jgi:lipopolysaccharide transport system permease protein
VPLLVGITFLVAYLVLSLHVLPWTLVFIPVLVATQFVGMAGLGFFLGALSVYFRDLRELVLVFTVIGVYVLPAFYPPGAIPSAFRVALFLNPFSYMVWCYQDTFFYGRLAHPWAWPVFILGCLLTYAVGFLLFRKLKTTFGNVL